MKEERLIRLADHLDTVPQKDFNILFWHHEDSYCGTVACAIGHACTIPEFVYHGFRLKRDERIGVGLTPTYKQYDGYEAVSEFLRISAADARYLFTAAGYGTADVSPKMVADRIRDYVRKN
jgi:hypothetical protein